MSGRSGDCRFCVQAGRKRTGRKPPYLIIPLLRSSMYEKRPFSRQALVMHVAAAEAAKFCRETASDI